MVSNAYLLETEYRRDGNAYYARFERVQKAGRELVLPNPFVAGGVPGVPATAPKCDGDERIGFALKMSTKR